MSVPNAGDPGAPLPVLVCGGGPVGSTLALALAGAGVRVGLAGEAAAPGDRAARRPIALSQSSVRILRTLGVWQAIEHAACPITTVHVSERGRFGMVRLRASEQGVEALGQVTDAQAIARALDAAVVASTGIERLGDTRVLGVHGEPEALRVQVDPAPVAALRARLLVVADGGTSGLRETLGISATARPYGQCAVVGEVAPREPHAGVAYERFTPSGPVALLPLADGCCALVWTLPEATARAVAELDDESFASQLQRAFGHRLGRLRVAGPRGVFPLTLVRSDALTASRAVLVGNAANRLHPVAGQGLNLGLRDAAVLADHVAGAVRAGRDPGADALLAAYARERAPDHRAVIRFTDLLARGFGVGPPLLGSLRSAAMLALDLVPPASRLLARRAMGLGTRQPRLVRGVMP